MLPKKLSLQSLTVFLLLTVSILSVAFVATPAPHSPAENLYQTPGQTSQYPPTPASSTTSTASLPLSSFTTPPAWTLAAPITTAREGYGAAAVNGLFYYVAGYGPSGDSTVNEAYNPVSNSWTTKASLPSSPRSETVAVTDGKFIYLVGGRPVPTVGHDLWRYNPTNDTWTRLSPMPTARATEHMAVYHNGRIYVAGGRSSGAPTESGDLATLEIYDVLSNTWTSGSPIPQPIADAYAIVLNDKMYLFGGFTTSGTTNTTTYVYDFLSDTWVTAAASPVGVVDPAVGMCGPLVYMIGGSNAFLSLQSSNYVYNPTTDTWNTSLAIPTPTAEVQAISSNSELYVVSGGIFGSGGSNPANQVFHCVDNQLLVSPAIQPAQPPGSTISYKIRVADFQPFTGWNIMVKTNQSVITPQTISVLGNLFQTNFTTTLIEDSNCVNGTGIGCGPNDGPGIAHSSAAISGLAPTNTTMAGLLFTITYKVIGGNYSPVTIFNDQIDGASPNFLPHTATSGVYGRPPPDFDLSTFPVHVLLGRQSSGFASIILRSLNGFNGTVILSATVSPSGPTFAFRQNSLSVSTNATAIDQLTISSTSQLPLGGNYSISVMGRTGSLSHGVVVRVTIVPDFSIAVDPSSTTLIPGGRSLSTVTLTSRDFSGTVQLTVVASPPSLVGPEVFLNNSLLSLSLGQSAQTVLFIVTYLNTAPGNYTATITATGVISHSASISLNILPPILTLSPRKGPIGTKVVVQGTRFPFYPGNFFPETIYVSFDDVIVGSTQATNGTFTFVLDVPFAQSGPHEIKVHDYYTGAHADASFQVLPTVNPISVSIQVGTVYFPGDTAVITILASTPGTTGSSTVNMQVILMRPDGTNASLLVSQIGIGLSRASYRIPSTGLIGTYAVLVKVTSAGQTANSLQTFEVKPTWLSSNSGNIVTGAVATAGVLGLIGVAWKKGYLDRNE